MKLINTIIGAKSDISMSSSATTDPPDEDIKIIYNTIKNLTEEIT